jgi:cell division protein FtsZ
VDQEANIIVGATFDETLEGIIRVSVVATGIEQAVAAAARSHAPAPVKTGETRLSELAQQIRAGNQRASERADRAEAAPAASGAAEGRGSSSAALSRSSAGAMEDVTIRPLAPKPSLFAESERDEDEDAVEEAFIPPAPERASRAPRMPRVEELPLPAQNEIRAKRGEVDTDQVSADTRRMSLLQRIASVGLGRREDAPAERQPKKPAGRAAHGASGEPRAPELADYAKRPAPSRATPHGLDHHGRQAPLPASVEEDQLEIPAFLRRQSN